MKLSLLPVLLCLLCCWANGQEDFGELARQVAETNKVLEELLANKLRDIHYATVIGELRAEIDSLRRDVIHLKEATKESSSGSATTTSENEAKTINWIQTNLAEMRAEIADVNRSVNVSRQLQEQQESSGQIQLIRSDVNSLQTVTADASAHRNQLNQSVQEVADHLQRLEAQQRVSSAQLERLESNMADLRLELELTSRRADEEPSVAGLKTRRNQRSRKIRSLLDNEDNEVMHQPSNRNKVRHNKKDGDMKHQVDTLRKMVRTLAGEQHDLQKQMVLLSQLRMTTESNVNKVHAELQTILAKMEASPGHMKCPNAEDVVEVSAQNRRLAESIEKLSLKVSGVDQVQSSTLQLFEALERLEERYDDNIGELQKEVSKLEFSDSQLASAVHQLREDQSGQSELVKSIRSSTTLLQEEVKAEQIRSALLMAKLTNNTLAVFNQTRSHQEHERRLSSLERDKSNLARIAKDLPHDCREVGSSSSGANLILPRGGSDEPIKVYCDQETSGGGWTVIQRRTDGKEDFNRNWAAYKSGFGSIHGEFWLGNDHLHELTKDNTTMLRVDLWDIYGQYWWAEYDSFQVSDERSGYAVQFHGYTGNASDAMASYHQSMKFSTRDNDQDLSNTNCADSYQGGWWYSHCQHVNINGKYALGLTWYDSLENEWIALARVEMKLRDKRIFSVVST